MEILVTGACPAPSRIHARFGLWRSGAGRRHVCSRVQSTGAVQKLPVNVGPREQKVWKLIAENVITALDNFAPAEEAENVGRLYDILDQLRPLSPDLRSPLISAILGLIERHPEAELGTPRPLVHELEALRLG